MIFTSPRWVIRASRATALVSAVLLSACSDDTTEPEVAEAPVVLRLSPDTIDAASASRTVTIIGGGFTRRTIVLLDEDTLATTFVRSTELRVTLDERQLITSRRSGVYVFTPEPGGGVAGRGLTIVALPAPTPTVDTATAYHVSTLPSAGTVTVRGTGFMPRTRVERERFGDQVPLPTQYRSSTELSVTVPDSSRTSTGVLRVSLFSAGPGGGRSNEFAIEIRAPVPTITSLGRSSVPGGADSLALRVTGSGFVRNSIVRVNGNARTTRWIASDTLLVSLAAADFATPGQYAVTVATPAPGGGVSNAATLDVTRSAPQLTRLPVPAVHAGAEVRGLSIHGSGFVSETRALWNGSPRPTQWVNGSRLTVDLTSADVAAPGSGTLVLETPGAGGGTSTAATVAILPVPSGGVTWRLLPITVIAITSDPARNLLFVTTGATGDSLANSLLAIDAVSGTVVRRAPLLVSTYNRIVLSSDRQSIFVASNSQPSLLRFNASTLASTGQWTLSDAYVRVWATLPGRPDALIATLGTNTTATTIGIIENGVVLPARINDADAAVSGFVPDITSDSAYAVTAFCCSQTTVQRLAISADGVRRVPPIRPITGVGAADIASVSDGLVYLNSGAAIDLAQARAVIPAGPSGRATLVEPLLGRRIAVSPASFGQTLISVTDLVTQRSLGSASLDGLASCPSQPSCEPDLAATAQRASADQVAVRIGGRIVLLRSPLFAP
jgi:hypothetical protein